MGLFNPETKLIDATLRDYAATLRGENRLLDFLSETFGGATPAAFSLPFSSFHDQSVFQYVLLDYMADRGYTLESVHGISTGSVSEHSCVFEPAPRYVACDKDQTFLFHNNAAWVFTGPARCVVLTSFSEWTKTFMSMVFHEDGKTLGASFRAYMDARDFYKGKVLSPSLEFLDIPKISFDDVILPPSIIETIRTHCNQPQAVYDVMAQYGIIPKRGVICEGEPGTGKSLLCKALANETTRTVIQVLPSDVARPEDINRIYTLAVRLAPSILVIEDIDYIAKSRDDAGNPWLLIELMNYLDGMTTPGDVITFATTNRLCDIEDAMKCRPGRFDRIINVPLPDFTARLRMFQTFLTDVDLPDVSLEYYAKKTDGMSGAYIREICLTAMMLAAHEHAVYPLTVTDALMRRGLAEITNKDFSCCPAAAPKKAELGFATSNLPTED